MLFTALLSSLLASTPAPPPTPSLAARDAHEVPQDPDVEDPFGSAVEDLYADVEDSTQTDVDIDLDPGFVAAFAELSFQARERIDTLSASELDTIVADYGASSAQDQTDEEIGRFYYDQYVRELDARLHYQTGDIEIGEGLATLHLGDAFRFLDSSDTRDVLINEWGNPPSAAASQLGMIVPADLSPGDRAPWGVVIESMDIGYVSDEDAEDIDYDELLRGMKKEAAEQNRANTASGYPTVSLIGWATPPHYDADRKRLYWAKELKFNGNDDNTLNYDIRVLGRRGVISLSAVGSMEQLDVIAPHMEQLMTTVEFEYGSRHQDFDPDFDQVAAYGIGGLIAGKVLAKTGFFAVLLKLLLAGKKLIIGILLGLAVVLRRMVGRRTDDR